MYRKEWHDGDFCFSKNDYYDDDDTNENDDGCGEYNNTECYTPIFLAVHNGNLNRFRFLLNENNLEEKVFGRRMLHVAAARGHLHIVDLLIKKGATINVKDYRERTPLFIALHENEIEVAEFLLENSTCLDIPSKDSIKILNVAVAKQSIKIVESLLKKSVNVNESNYPCFWKSMAIAARVGNLEIVKLLMSNIFDKFDSKNYEYSKPLRMALAKHHLDIVKYLLENISIIDTKNPLIHYCTTDKHTDILKCLLDFGLKQNVYTSKNTLLLQSFARGELKLWRYLLTCFSKIEAELCSKETELHSAVRANQIENVKEILNKVEMKSLAGELGQFAVYIAVENGNEEILKILLEAGCSVDSCFRDNITPLHIAATSEHTRLVEILLKHGAKINSKTKECIVPLDFAASAGHFNMIKFLLASGAKPPKKRRIPTLNHVLCGAKSTITPSMFQNILKITELLLIAGDLKERDRNIIDDLLTTVINLKISVENLQTSNISDNKEIVNIKEKNEEFRTAIIRCLFNYLKKSDLAHVLDSQLEKYISVIIFEIISEYYDFKVHRTEIGAFVHNWSYLFIVNEIEDVDKLLNVIQKNVHSSIFEGKQNVLLKLIIGRLELLAPRDKRIIECFNSREDVTKIQEFQNECRLQIINMQKTKVIDELNLTFYDILVKPFDIITRCIRDETLLNTIELSYDKFSAYAKLLKLRIERAKRKIDVIDMSTNYLYHYIEGNFRIQFSTINIEKILQYLSMSDLRILTSAFS
ncbi:ankyrin-1-like [Leptopilina heterotoma]|uniref:ankyrin-1-like n=1 Tax=Leptopilina heterotoma TaxID=63436 RepID=UPI001CA93B8F|nr:ankyrin-1-like [Leptopilina heterotoma]XP_043469840.1 ankyrin-1-like [Leptopilina heterotoma]